jgi:hypothetical protein
MQISDIKTDKQTGELYYAPLDSTALDRARTAASQMQMSQGKRSEHGLGALEGSIHSSLNASGAKDDESELVQKDPIAIHDDEDS